MAIEHGRSKCVIRNVVIRIGQHELHAILVLLTGLDGEIEEAEQQVVDALRKAGASSSGARAGGGVTAAFAAWPHSAPSHTFGSHHATHSWSTGTAWSSPEATRPLSHPSETAGAHHWACSRPNTSHCAVRIRGGEGIVIAGGFVRCRRGIHFWRRFLFQRRSVCQQRDIGMIRLGAPIATYQGRQRES